MCADGAPGYRATPWSQHVLVWAVFFLMGSDLFLIPPLLPVMSEQFGTSISATAWVVTTFGLAYASVSPIFGALTTNRRRREVILLGVAVMATGVIVTGLAPSLAVALIGRVIGGLGGALVGPVIWAYLAESAAPHERGRAIARAAAAYAGGQIVGVPLGTVLAAGAGWRWAFVGLAVGFALAGTMIAFRLREPPRPVQRSRKRSAMRASVGLWQMPTFRLILSANSAAQTARLGAYAYAGAIFAEQFGFGTGVLGVVGAVVGLGSFTGSLVAGPVVDWWRAGRRAEPALGMGWAIMLAASLALATAADEWWLALIGFAASAFAGAAFFSTSQVFLTTVTGSRRSAAVAWNNSALYLGTAIGATALGGFGLGSLGFVLTAAAFGLFAASVSGFLALRLRR
ncbi:MFS transporter [Antrihabitans sp. YC2-6]|uniref:MFS transporter n=1 Tax=Antrihabitans sp. YC2-6 TaxID=2799498 RepID=UPI0018F55767|nr:MFS transporter [Antrihabitans sp. YC2-6]MBJ8348119.1 MFS transporter [Antrihabitans sp. YC2-6]